MTYSWYFRLTSWHFSVTTSAADPASACLPPCFPSSKTQTWPVGLVVMMMVETGYLAGGNQSRTQYTMIKFLNPRAKFPLCLLLLPLHFSTPMLPLSSSASPSPLLSFPFTFLDMWYSGDAQVTVFTAQPAQCCIHSFLPCFLPHSPAFHIPSKPTPPSPRLLTEAYFTMAHIKQPDEGNTVRLFSFSEEYDPSKGHIVCLTLSLCVFLQLWFVLLKMRES